MKKIPQFEVLHSNAGYYIGTADEMGIPEARLTDYYPTYTEAYEALTHNTYTIRNAPEVSMYLNMIDSPSHQMATDIEERIQLLRRANQYVLSHINDKTLIIDWWFLVVPDEPTDEDYFDLAMDDDDYLHVLQTFTNILLEDQ